MRIKAERIDELVGNLDGIADPHIQSTARELIQSVMEMHADGLKRLLQIISQSGERSAEILRQLGDDELVGALLAVHDLHPVDLRIRIAQAVDKAQPHLQKLGGEAELIGIEEGNVRLRIRSSGHGCGSTAGTLEAAVEDAIYSAAPDLASLVIESEEGRDSSSGFVPLEALRVGIQT